MKKNNFITKISRVPGDKTIWLMVVVLVVISLVAVYSSIGKRAIELSHTTPLHDFMKHVAFVVGGIVIAFVCSKIPYKYFARVSVAWYLIWAVLLYVLRLAHHSRWLSIGGFSLQPSEFEKIGLILLLAYSLTLHKSEPNSLRYYFRYLFIICLVAVVIFLDNFSTAFIMGVTGMVMLYFGGVSRKYWFRTLAVVAVLGVGVGIYANFAYHNMHKEDGLISIERASTWGHRLDSFFHPDNSDLSQANMAHMAVASGGLGGVGVGNTVHARLMTQADNDFIFAIIIEEKGALAAIFIFIIYTILFFRCMKLADNCQGQFGSLILLGCGTVIYVQALVHMLVSVGIFPVTGQTLPLISSGGSSYLTMGMIIGIIQSTADDTIKKEQQRFDKKKDDAAFEEIKNLSEHINAQTQNS